MAKGASGVGTMAKKKNSNYFIFLKGFQGGVQMKRGKGSKEEPIEEKNQRR